MSERWPEMPMRPGARRARSEQFGFVALALALANLVWTTGEVRRVERLSDPEPPYFSFLVISWTADVFVLAVGTAVLWISTGRVVDVADRAPLARLGVYAAVASMLISGGLLMWTWFL